MPVVEESNIFFSHAEFSYKYASGIVGDNWLRLGQHNKPILFLVKDFNASP